MMTTEPEWSGKFIAPIDSTVSEGFGTRRTFNGKLASIHRGLDYHAKPGSPVVAANSGEVVLAQELFYEGNCVIIDHGQQFMSLYMHLSHLEVTRRRKGEEGAGDWFVRSDGPGHRAAPSYRCALAGSLPRSGPAVAIVAAELGVECPVERRPSAMLRASFQRRVSVPYFCHSERASAREESAFPGSRKI